MRLLVLAALASLLAPIASAQGACSAETRGDGWEVSGGSKSYSLKTSVYLTIPDTGKIKFIKYNPLLGLTDVYGSSGELNYRSDGDIYFRIATPVTYIDSKPVSIAQILQSQNKQLYVGFREPGAGVFALAALGDQMAGPQPTVFGILKAEQAKPLHERLNSGAPFDVILATDNALFAEAKTFTFMDFTAGKASGEAMLADLKAQVAAGTCK